jgi:hypothetical protein
MAAIRWKTRRSPAGSSGFANHRNDIAGKPGTGNQRFQISASTTTATVNSPTNRIMIVPIGGGVVRNGMGSALSGRTLFIELGPRKYFAAVNDSLLLVAARTRQVQ